MTITVRFNAAVARLCGGASETSVEVPDDPATVHDVILGLLRARPGIGTKLLNCEGELRSVIRPSVNGAAATVNSPVRNGDEILFAAG